MLNINEDYQEFGVVVGSSNPNITSKNLLLHKSNKNIAKKKKKKVNFNFFRTLEIKQKLSII